MNTHSSAPELVALREGEAPLVVSEVWLSLGSIELREGESCVAPAEQFSSLALGAADHAHPEPAFTGVEAPSGNYTCMSAAILPIQGSVPDGAPVEFEGQSILIRALLDDTTSVTVKTTTALDVPILALAGSYSLADDQASFFLGFDVAEWLAPLDFTNADREPDGSVQVSATENTALHEAFLSNVPGGLELYRDADGDGVLDQNPQLLGRGEGP